MFPAVSSDTNAFTRLIIENRVFAFLGDEAFENSYDLIPSRHYSLDLILGEVVLCFLLQFRCVQLPQFLP